ncbi:MAG: hypothetical protein ACI9C1_002951 [Candidatus Aldehydirespiratoraceae bacterium]|jgi:hypothetical protein
MSANCVSSLLVRRISPTSIRSRAAVAVASIALVVTACGSADSGTETTAPSDNAAAPAATDWSHDFTADTYGGGTIDAGDYEGQDLVLWFWAPW